MIRRSGRHFIRLLHFLHCPIMKALLHGIPSQEVEDKEHGAKVERDMWQGVSNPKSPYVGIWQLWKEWLQSGDI